MVRDLTDPKGVIYESYRIDGICLEECRSIFFDWALSIDAESAPKHLIADLLDRHAPTFPDHPMTQVLREGLAEPVRTGRRGGRAGRLK